MKIKKQIFYKYYKNTGKGIFGKKYLEYYLEIGKYKFKLFTRGYYA